MLAFIVRRIVVSIPVLLGILAVTFLLAHLIPGDPCRAMLGERATAELCNAYKARMGLDQPITTQFMVYAGHVFQGDLGTSLRYGRSISDLLAERLPVTLELGIAAMIFAVIIGIPLGIISAYRHNSAVDVGTMVGANIGVSMPVFWLGLMLAYLFGVLLKDTPFALPPSGRLPAGFNPTPFYVVWGLAKDPDSASGLLVFLSRLNILNAILTLNGDLFVNALRYMILPAVAVGTIPMSIIARMTRSSVLETLGQDYVRTARAKGLRELNVVLSHAVRNALLPVVTIIGLNFGGLVSGAVLTETIFGLTGLGRTLVDGITARDYTLVQGFTIVIAVSFVLINLVVDLLYGYLDPRIRLS
ncbi:MAG: ABC transporter permease subunit [Chloroflexi bacterium]|nr:ABC transporter permease subunit [Chloroflexota bacterium]